MYQLLMEDCHPEFSLVLCIWIAVTPTLLHCVFEKRVGAPTADGEFSLGLCFWSTVTNIAALCS